MNTLQHFIFQLFSDYDSLIDENEESFDGTRFIPYTKSHVNLESTDFSLAVLLKTMTNGTILSKTGASWASGNLAFLVDFSGFVSLQIKDVGSIAGKTKVNDGQWHEVAVVYSMKESK